jgi:hypothetical protein
MYYLPDSRFCSIDILLCADTWLTKRYHPFLHPDHQQKTGAKMTPVLGIYEDKQVISSLDS